MLPTAIQCVSGMVRRWRQEAVRQAQGRSKGVCAKGVWQVQVCV
jgi:hypothetical protein